MAIETALAEGSMTRIELREPANVYHVMTIADMEPMAPDFDW